jgi:putative tricarboxylic transport membrane protein
MLEKEQLRKADIFSGLAIFLFGLFIVLMASQMPMKDSWGGVQNVWYVSPALFPLFVGGVIMLLGAFLIRTALKMAGKKALAETIRWLGSRKLFQFLTSDSVIRFYAIAVLFLSLVYLNLPRIDFFLSSILFLAVFITMFYFDDDQLLKKLFWFYLAGVGVLIVYFALGLDPLLGRYVPFAADILTIGFILAYCIYAWALIRSHPPLRRKYRISLTVAVAAPFIIGPIFKYFLMVPMPTEGLIVAVLDYFWYFEF